MNKHKILGKIGYTIFKIISFSLKKTRYTSNKFNNNDQYIVVFWHRKIFLSANTTRIISHKAALVSPSKDGEMLAELLIGEGNKVIRGSSNRDNIKSLKEILRLIKLKYSIGIAIDGPKGPIFDPKGGAVYIAQKSGLPIVVATGYASKKWILKTWDRMEIPKPFSKVVLYTGDPFYIPKDMSIEKATVIVKEKLHENAIEAYEEYKKKYLIGK